MPKARNILKRARSIRNIRTITRTMEMVATSQFKKLHDRVLAARRLSDRMAAMVADLLRRGGGLRRVRHPLLEAAARPKRDALVVISSSRGLCGGYNTAVTRVARERLDQLAEAGFEVLLYASGRRGADLLRRAGRKPEQVLGDLGSPPEFDLAADLADNLMQAFLVGEIEGVEIAYTRFVSSGQQKAAISQVLPLSCLEAGRDLIARPARELVPYEFLPSPAEVLDKLLPSTVRLRVYQCFLDAALSEHVARMTAMRSATESADEMIHDLTIRYNRLRQAQITTELAEVFGGRDEAG